MSLSLEKRISSFSRLGSAFLVIADVLESPEAEASDEHKELFSLQRQCTIMNPWFSKANIVFAFRNWGMLLNEGTLSEWLKPYKISESPDNLIKRVAVINAGNIPLVGFHDFLSILLSGNQYIAKNASDDQILLPYVADLLINYEPEFKSYIRFSDRLSDFDAVIATGSNNSSRYFEYYFGKYPHIIRKNRNGVAVLDESDSTSCLSLLGEDIFRYYGLGCRNVSKLYVPEGYNFNDFFKSIYDRSEVMQHNKYMNNFEHHNALLLLKQVPFLQNGFLILMENKAFSSPVAVLNYEYYSDKSKLKNHLTESLDKIQCIVSSSEELKSDPVLKSVVVDFGKTQFPGLADYADGVDTIKFLKNLPV